jgi:hypothetical protein
VSSSRQAISLADESGFTRPLAAAPATGGRGDVDSWLVNSVGLGRIPAGGVMEVEVLPEWCLPSICGPFDDGALRTFGMTRSTSPGSWFSGSDESLKPWPTLCRRQSWTLKKVWKTGANSSCAT